MKILKADTAVRRTTSSARHASPGLFLPTRTIVSVTMQIWPAIDLLGGKCVRLQQGDYDRQTVFSEDPLEMAIRWQKAGTRYLHLVDLDGARDGSLVNGPVISRIVQQTGLICQVGGGVRDQTTIDGFWKWGSAESLSVPRPA